MTVETAGLIGVMLARFLITTYGSINELSEEELAKQIADNLLKIYKVLEVIRAEQAEFNNG